jgi:hypothetical protein
LLALRYAQKVGMKLPSGFCDTFYHTPGAKSEMDVALAATA